MRILVTGATGYIGKRLFPVLVEQGHEVICAVRDADRLEVLDEHAPYVQVVEMDFLQPIPDDVPTDFDAAYYLIHSLSSGIGDFEEKEARSAQHFVDYVDRSNARQIIYLTGIVNEHTTLSKHLRSRLAVEEVLRTAAAALTALRAGIIVGSGSASFEIIRDLVEKLPVMVAPKWLHTKCQPIAIRNVMQYLTGVLHREDTYDQHFDLGEQVVTYLEMLKGYAEVRGLKRWFFIAPVMTPRFSSYWLYFITSTSYPLAVNLVDSMKIDVVGTPNDLDKRLDIEHIPYKEAVEMAFQRIEQNLVASSWKDSFISSTRRADLDEHIEVPTYGVFTDKKKRSFEHAELERVMTNIWSIGGTRGWYYGDWLWKIRGYLDKLAGGVGLRRGRTNPNTIYTGDALDFWRVLVADPKKRRLLLYAEMKLPGEAWLEFRVVDCGDGTCELRQTATFRPEGLAGRAYWYAVLPFHHFIFNGMIDNILAYPEERLMPQLGE